MSHMDKYCLFGLRIPSLVFNNYHELLSHLRVLSQHSQPFFRSKIIMKPRSELFKKAKTPTNLPFYWMSHNLLVPSLYQIIYFWNPRVNEPEGVSSFGPFRGLETGSKFLNFPRNNIRQSF